MQTWNPVRRLHELARNAPWVVMAIALHAIVLVALSLWYVSKEKTKAVEQTFVCTIAPPKLAEAEPPKEEPLVRDHLPEPPDADLDYDDYDPPTDVAPDDSVQPAGDPTSLLEATNTFAKGNTAIGVGQGGVRGGSVDPFGMRRLPGRGVRGPGSRRHEGTEKLVLEGLRWLVRHQNPDGSWSAAGCKDRCDAATPCVDPKESYHDLYDEGTTALALLCFLGAGHGHDSKTTIVDPVRAKRVRIGEVVKNGLVWLAKRQQANGQFSRDKAFLYNEALATMALAEAYGLTRGSYWKEPAQKGVEFLQRAQRPNPSGQGAWGWRYLPRSEVEDFRKTGTDPAASKELYDADTSVTTWCVMALKSAQLADLTVDRASMDGALEFVKWVTADNGMVGYIDPKGAGAVVTGRNDHFKYHPAVMSALGMCSRAFVAHDVDDPVLELSAKQVAADLPSVSKDALSIDYYYWYYGSLALNQFDGPDSPRKSGKLWTAWNHAMVDALTALQNTEERTCRRGGWVVPDRWSYAGGPVYSTALAVLTLEVYYRYSNAFAGAQRAR